MFLGDVYFLNGIKVTVSAIEGETVEIDYFEGHVRRKGCVSAGVLRAGGKDTGSILDKYAGTPPGAQLDPNWPDKPA